MKSYIALILVRFRAGLQYRVAALAGVTTQIFWGFIKIMVLEAFYGVSTVVQPMSFAQVVSYTWLGQGLLALLPWNVDPDIRELIRSGSVSYELLRPLDLYSVWFVRTLAWRTSAVILRCIPLFIFAGPVLVLIGLQDIALTLPRTFEALILFVLSMTVTVAMSCCVSALNNILTMWTLSALGPSALLPVAITIFSGMIIPLPLMPDWVVPVLRALPFSGLIDTPFRIYSGNLAGKAAIYAILHQIGWTIALVYLGRVLIRGRTRRLVIQGG